ncbi:MAG: hypothetical protein L0387_18200 [Acidobacteria bacterium]|nr:hypothetical protein [Acidobacteriota bacterium]
MPSLSGSFSGSVRMQTSISPPDLPNRELNLAEITGAQKCTDALWDDAGITYWGFTDIAEGKGTQRGYFVNVHGEADRDWGTFEGRVTMSGSEINVEGTWQFVGGSGKFNGLTGDGTFKTRMTSPTTVEAYWQGAYELAGARAMGA